MCRVAEGVLVRSVGTESVILNLRSETYMGLDSTGSRMWAALTESVCVDVAYQKLLEQYDIGPQTLRRDVQEFVETLVGHGLLGLTAAAPE